MTDHAREAAQAITRDFICGRGVVFVDEWRHASPDEIAAVVKPHIDAETADLRAKVERLRKILSHVPAKVAIKAKEDAGFGEEIRPC